MGLFKPKSKPPTAGSKQEGNLAVAYDVQSRNRKKYAKGGIVSSDEDDNQYRRNTLGDKTKTGYTSEDMEYAQRNSNAGPYSKEYKDQQLNNTRGAYAKGGEVEPKEVKLDMDSDKKESMKMPPVIIAPKDDSLQKYTDNPEAYAMGGHVCQSCGHQNEMNEPEMLDDTIPTFDHEDDEGMHFDSAVDAIMAKRRFAQGGEVDEDANNEEGPGEDISQNLKAAKKESYDDDQIIISGDNEEGDDDLQKDKEDRVSAIRKKMSRK